MGHREYPRICRCLSQEPGGQEAPSFPQCGWQLLGGCWKILGGPQTGITEGGSWSLHKSPVVLGPCHKGSLGRGLQALNWPPTLAPLKQRDQAPDLEPVAGNCVDRSVFPSRNQL